jgi:flavin-dependent dehydrogenase
MTISRSPPRGSSVLDDGSRVGVIGGGPAGSLFAYFLLRAARSRGVDLNVDIYEPRDFTLPGPLGCNMCGGVVSEFLVDALAADGIMLPHSVVQRPITSYIFTTDEGSVRVEMPSREKRIAALHRGAGPRGLVGMKWTGLDGHLLHRATTLGARLIPRRVDGLDRNAGRPVVRAAGAVTEYDLLVGAAGVNTVAGRLFGRLGLPAARPRVSRAYITELPIDGEEISRGVGDAMHIFLLRIPKLEFAAIIPKHDVLTVCLLGRNIGQEMITAFFESPPVRRCLPFTPRLPDGVCHCAPFINIGAAPRPFADRVVLVGDCGVTRLYKDGVGAAYRTAKAAAATAVQWGISSGAFRAHYWPVYRSIVRDNQFGRFLFYGVREFRDRRPLLRGLLSVVAREQAGAPRQRRMSRVLWDIFTGSAEYRDIFTRAIDPRLVGPFLWESVRLAVWGDRGHAVQGEH